MAAKCKASFILLLHRLPSMTDFSMRSSSSRRDRSEAIVALTGRRRARCWNASNCAASRCPTGRYRKAGVHRSFNPLTRRSFANALLRNGRITVLHSFLPLLYIIPRRQRRRRGSYTRFIVIRRYLASKKGSPGDSSQPMWSVVLQFDAHASVVENRELP